MLGLDGAGLMLEWYDSRVYDHVPLKDREKCVPEGSVLHVSCSWKDKNVFVNSFAGYDPRNDLHNKHLDEKVLDWSRSPFVDKATNVLGLNFV